MKASPEFGKILEEAYDLQMRGKITNSEEARKFAQKLYEAA